MVWMSFSLSLSSMSLKYWCWINYLIEKQTNNQFHKIQQIHIFKKIKSFAWFCFAKHISFKYSIQNVVLIMYVIFISAWRPTMPTTLPVEWVILSWMMKCAIWIYCRHLNSGIMHGMSQLGMLKLGSLVVKMLACCTGGPGFITWVENPKLSTIPAGCCLSETLNCWPLAPVSMLGK